MAKRTTFDVFVGNLPTDANEKNVGKIFSKYGEIQTVFVKEPQNNSQLKYAFVKFLCEPDAEKACTELNGQEVEGKKVIVRRQEHRKSARQLKDGDKLSRLKSSGGSKFSQPDIVPEGADVESNSSYGSGTSYENREKEPAMVTYVETPVTLWAQIVNEENTNKLRKMVDQLATLCPAAAKVNGPPQQNKVYAAQFSEDMSWYRCTVKQQIAGTDKLKVLYIDYGNNEEVLASNLVEIPPNLASIKALASKFVLHNTKAVNLNNQKGIGLLRSLTEGKVVQVVRTRPLNDGTGHYAILHVDGQNLNNMMVDEGHAVKRPPKNAASDNMGGSGMPSGVSGGGGDATYMGQKFGAGASPFSYSNSGYGSDLLKGRTGSGGFGTSRQLMGELGKMKAQGYSESEDALKKELAQKQKEIEKLRGELAKHELHLQQATANKVQLHTVVDLAKKVRKLRIQFPTGRASGLEEAVKLALSDDRVQNSRVTTLQPVISSIAMHKAAQKEICTCKDPTEMEGLIQVRDTARRDLYGKLENCIQELISMPLERRHDAVKAMEQKLCKDYHSFLVFTVPGCPQLEDLSHGFKDWKSHKEQEFSHWRDNTDKCKTAMVESLHKLADMMNLESSMEDHTSRVDLDSLLRSYSQALQKELAVTDLEHSTDAKMVATILTAILKELRGELKSVDSLQTAVRDFRQLQNSIEPWLNDKPSLTGIIDKRKAIRGIKSKLRHKEADRQDLEEGGDSTDEDLVKVKADVDLLKQQLHEALLAMDEELKQLAVNSDNHFPELILQHQDIGIEIQLAYGGLVKSGREIEHYTLEPCIRSGMNSSVFAGKPVFLQETNIGDTDHLSKADFLQEVMKYAETVQDSYHLLDVEGVFFSKNDRQAYIQYNRPSELRCLTDFMKEEVITDKLRQNLFYGVTAGITHLHYKSFVHGEVNPSNVAVRPDGSTILLPPEFSRSPIDRVRKRYITENGLRFQPLEMMSYIQQGLIPQVSLDCDMYNLGLLLLWIHNPHGHIEQQADGSPKVHSLSLDQDTMKVLYSQLCPNPDSRLPASHILQSTFLTRVLTDPVHSQSETSLKQEVVTDGGFTSQESDDIGDAYLAPLPDEDFSSDITESETSEGISKSVTGTDAMLSSHCEQDMEETVEDTMTNIGMFSISEAEKIQTDKASEQMSHLGTDTSAVDRLAQDLASLPPLTGMPVFSNSDTSDLDNTAAAFSSLSNMVSNSEVPSMNLASHLHLISESQCQISSGDVQGKQEVENPDEANPPTEDTDEVKVKDSELDIKSTCEDATPVNSQQTIPRQGSRSPLDRILKSAASQENI